jgi:hypothetical protein
VALLLRYKKCTFRFDSGRCRNPGIGQLSRLNKGVKIHTGPRQFCLWVKYEQREEKKAGNVEAKVRKRKEQLNGKNLLKGTKIKAQKGCVRCETDGSRAGGMSFSQEEGQVSDHYMYKPSQKQRIFLRNALECIWEQVPWPVNFRRRFNPPLFGNFQKHLTLLPSEISEKSREEIKNFAAGFNPLTA